MIASGIVLWKQGHSFVQEMAFMKSESSPGPHVWFLQNLFNIILASMPILQNSLFLLDSQLQYCMYFSSLCESLYNGMQNIKMSLFQNITPYK